MFAHELRAPLTAIIGYTEMLQSQLAGPVNEQQGEFLDDLLRSAHHMSVLITDTLNLARLEGGELSLRLKTFDVVEMLDVCLRQVLPRATSLQIELRAELPEGPAIVTGDRHRLIQLVVNLLDNAVKFTPAGGAIVLALTLREHDYDIVVRDTGIGIPEPDQGRIFRRFEQLGEERALRENEGIGLGLALVKKLTELHRGDILVESVPERGSCFRVRLPRDSSSVDVLSE